MPSTALPPAPPPPFHAFDRVALSGTLTLASRFVIYSEM
jgi:hypothetical protein